MPSTQHTSPCKTCPFVHGTQTVLHGERAEEIATALRCDKSFHCHNTIDYSEGDGRVTVNSRECAGALQVLHLETGGFNQMGRIAARLGLFDGEALVAEAEGEECRVFGDLDEFIDYHEEHS